MSKRAPDGITTVKQAGKELEIIFGNVVFRPTKKSVFKERNLVFIYKRGSEAEVMVTDYQHPNEI